MEKMNPTISTLLTFQDERATLSIGVNGEMFSVSQEDARFEPLRELLSRNEFTVDEINEVLKGQSEQIQAALNLGEKLSAQGGIVYFDGIPVGDELSSHVIQQAKLGFPVVAFERFMENILKNPSYRAVKELYPFLVRGKNSITPDGCFLAYKRVKENYRDVHTGDVLNKPGSLLTEEERNSLPAMMGDVKVSVTPEGVTCLEMPRYLVDDNSERTCSAGLHVCSFDYAKVFPGSRLVVCKVNPRDVVSIPKDYDDTKMRVCRYEVVAEIDAEHRKDVLGERAVVIEDEGEIDVLVFEVQRRVDDEAVESCARLASFDEACTKCDDMANVRQFSADGAEVSFVVVNRISGKQLYKAVAQTEDEEDDASHSSGHLQQVQDEDTVFIIAFGDDGEQVNQVECSVDDWEQVFSIMNVNFLQSKPSRVDVDLHRGGSYFKTLMSVSYN